MKRILWTLFWIVLATTLCSAQTTLYLPQIADGQQGGFGWTTAVTITNPAAPGTSLATGTLSFTKDDGTAFNISLTDVLGAPVAVSGGNVPFQIAGGQTKLYVSIGTAPLITVGYATVTSNVPVVTGAVFFEYSTNTGSLIADAGVAAATPTLQQASIVSMLGHEQTGIAVANPSAQTATVTFQVLDTNGAQVFPPVNRALLTKNHTAFFINQLFPGLQNNFFGTVRVTSTQPVVTTSLLFEADGKFSTIPVFPLP
jgi:hypothetical protein